MNVVVNEAMKLTSSKCVGMCRASNMADTASLCNQNYFYEQFQWSLMNLYVGCVLSSQSVSQSSVPKNIKA